MNPEGEKNAPERRAKERELADRMTRAYDEFLVARAEAERLSHAAQGARGSDGRVAREKLLELSQRKSESLRRYREALDDFAQFVLHHIEP